MSARRALAALALAGLAGCGSLTVPVTGESATGERFAGTATAEISGKGSFQAATAGGVTCGGTYNALDASRRISVPFSCSDGRSGIVDVTRDPGGVSGVGSGAFSDGAAVTFIFGRR